MLDGGNHLGLGPILHLQCTKQERTSVPSGVLRTDLGFQRCAPVPCYYRCTARRWPCTAPRSRLPAIFLGCILLWLPLPVGHAGYSQTLCVLPATMVSFQPFPSLLPQVDDAGEQHLSSGQERASARANGCSFTPP